MDWRLDISLPMLAKALYTACEAGGPVDK